MLLRAMTVQNQVSKNILLIRWDYTLYLSIALLHYASFDFIIKYFYELNTPD